MQRTTYRFLGGALALAAVLTPVLFLTARASEPDSPTAQKAPADDAKPALTVGMPAPDFALPDQEGKTHRLSDLRGKTVVLAFYPADMTTGCTAQMCSLRDNLPQLQSEGAVVFGISVQNVASKRAFADKYHLNFPILADSEKKVSQAYGVLGQRGVAERVTFIIAPDGTIKNIDRALRFDRKPDGVVSSHAAALALALKADWRAQIGQPIPSFTLKNYDGKPITSTDSGSKATVLMFVSTQCPVSNAYNGRMEKLAQEYGSKGVRFLGINANRGEAPEQIAAHAKANDLTFPVLKDTRNVIADHFNAQRTPEVWALDSRGMARYHGAIDDSQSESGIQHRYLADALDAVLAGKEPPQTMTKAFGCSIKRVK